MPLFRKMTRTRLRWIGQLSYKGCSERVIRRKSRTARPLEMLSEFRLQRGQQAGFGFPSPRRQEGAPRIRPDGPTDTVLPQEGEHLPQLGVPVRIERTGARVVEHVELPDPQRYVPPVRARHVGHGPLQPVRGPVTVVEVERIHHVREGRWPPQGE